MPCVELVWGFYCFELLLAAAQHPAVLSNNVPKEKTNCSRPLFSRSPIHSQCGIDSVHHLSGFIFPPVLFNLMPVQQPGLRNINPYKPATPWHLILFGNESLHYWFWLGLYVCLQFVLHCSLTEAHYIRPTINLQAFAQCLCIWTKVGGQQAFFRFVFSFPCIELFSIIQLKPSCCRSCASNSLGSF